MARVKRPDAEPWEVIAEGDGVCKRIARVAEACAPSPLGRAGAARRLSDARPGFLNVCAISFSAPHIPTASAGV